MGQKMVKHSSIKTKVKHTFYWNLQALHAGEGKGTGEKHATRPEIDVQTCQRTQLSLGKLVRLRQSQGWGYTRSRKDLLQPGQLFSSFI